MQPRYSNVIRCPQQAQLFASAPAEQPCTTSRCCAAQVVAATGQVLLHRFYCKQSMTEYDVKVRC